MSEDRSDQSGNARELAERVEGMARSARVDRILCGTDSGRLFRALQHLDPGVPLVPATPNPETFEDLAARGCDPVRLSVRVTDKYGQARHTIARVLAEGRVSPGETVLCVVAQALPGGGGDLMLVTEVEPSSVALRPAEMLRLTEGVRHHVLEAALRVARRLGRISGRGKRLGALFAIGDSDAVLDGARQLVPNPFENAAEDDRYLARREVEDTIVELAKLDGAFVLRGDGLIRTAGTYLATGVEAVDVPEGLGARHVAAASVTARTNATAVVVSATDGHVRVFSDGELAMHVDPEVPLHFPPDGDAGRGDEARASRGDADPDRG